jgi:PAS domain S-box-containing protein
MTHLTVDQKSSVRMGLILGALVLFGGLFSLAGWWLEIPRLTDWFNTGISMMPNAALAFTVIGFALVMKAAERSRLVIGASAIAGTIGLLTFMQHLFSADLGIDQLLVEAEWGQRGTMAPGRMGLPASFMFVLISSAFILSYTRLRQLSAYLACACIVVSLLSVVGYLYGAQSLYIIPRWTAISFGTAILFIALAIGIIVMLPDVQPMRTLKEQSGTGALVRRALPLLIILPIVIGWLRIVGLEMGLYDHNFGLALHVIVQVILFTTLLWWMAKAVQRHERQAYRNEAALRASEERYRSFIHNSSEGIWRIELEQPIDTTLPTATQIDLAFQHGVMSECNDAMARMYGFNGADELVGARLGDVMPRTPANEAYLTAFIEGGYTLNGGESEERDRNGLPVFFSNNLVGMVENGKLLRAWGTQSDVTERKLTEEALREADRRKDEFLATLSHELRNPLSPLVSGLELITTTRETLDPQELHTIEGMMQRQLRHMVRLIDDLMDMNRINRGKIDLRFENVPLVSVLNSAVETCGPMLEQFGHRLIVHVPEAPIFIRGDAVRLAQIFQNVLNNAAKYTNSGGTIEVSAKVLEDEVVVSVKDTGIGLAPEDLPKIFEMFGQVGRSETRPTSGLGIGLALVRRLVEKHGGSITAYSAGLGKGSTFTVRLPLVKELVPA